MRAKRGDLVIVVRPGVNVDAMIPRMEGQRRALGYRNAYLIDVDNPSLARMSEAATVVAAWGAIEPGLAEAALSRLHAEGISVYRFDCDCDSKGNPASLYRVPQASDIVMWRPVR